MHQDLGSVPSKRYEHEADIYKAFAHPTRLRVLEFIGDQERTISTIRHELNVSGPNLSQHLRILKTAGLLTTTRYKQQVYCSCTSPAIRDLCLAMHKALEEHVCHRDIWAV